MSLNNKMVIPSKRTQFLATFCQQSFSLPSDSIIYYILKNPSTPELYQKLIQCCKYFFIKNPILIVSRLSFNYRNDWYTVVNEKRIKFKNISSKIWVTGAIEIYQNQNEQSRIPSLISKLYQCENKHLNLSYGNIFFNDFKFIASKCYYIWLYDSTVINENGSIISLEKIIEILPNINDFKYDLPDDNTKIVTSKTVKEMLKLPQFLSFIELSLENVPEIFDIDTFYEYMKKNNKTQICLRFSAQISEEYKNKLQTIIDEIKETDDPDTNKNHFIEFP